jgi:hypothetical protein
MACLERAVEARDTLLPWLGLMPLFDRFRGHAGFKSVMERVGLLNRGSGGEAGGGLPPGESPSPRTVA